MINASDREKRIKEQTSFLKIKRKGYKGVKNKPALSNKKEANKNDN